MQKQRRSLDTVSDTSVESIPQRCKSCDASLRVSRHFSDTCQLSPPKSLTQCRHSDIQLMTSLDESVPLDRCSVASEPMSLNIQLSDSSPRLSVKSKSTGSILSSRLTPPLFNDALDDDTVTRPCSTSTPVPHHFSMTHLNVCRHHQRSSSAVELGEQLHHDSTASLHHQCSAPADASMQHCDVSLVLVPASPDISGCDQVEPPVLQCLPPQSQRILRQFSVQNHFPKVTQVLM